MCWGLCEELKDSFDSPSTVEWIVGRGVLRGDISSLLAQQVKNPPVSAGDTGSASSIPGSGRSPGERNSNPLQYSCLENSIDRGAWRESPGGHKRVRHDLATTQVSTTPTFPGGWIRNRATLDTLWPLKNVYRGGPTISLTSNWSNHPQDLGVSIRTH